MNKRIFDLILLVILVPIVFPVFVIVYLLVLLNLGRPAFFFQERGGFKGRRFRLAKFRSMTNARDMEGRLLPDAARITLFGGFLRRMSLDELPCLWNVAKGDMSFVGPRPFIADYLPLYTPEQMRRHDAMPGITGWAQVNGRNALTWEQKFQLDLWYVDHRSVCLDLKILAMTVGKVLRRQGIDADGQTTMPRFEGTPSER